MASGPSSKITIYDVAERAGVAISTVSRVLNESHDVSDKTRERVMKIIDELKFRPDRTAKTLAQKTAQVIAIAIPTFTTPFHNELLKGIRYRLRDQDVDLLLYDLGSDEPDREVMPFLRRGAVDGLLLAGVEISAPIALELKAWHAPVVLVGTQHDQFDSYYWDDREGARKAVAHLIEQGHERIGMIRAHSQSLFQDQRIGGYRDALEEASIPFDVALVQSGSTEKHGGFSEEAGHEAMKQLLELDAPPTAVFASSDVQAVGAMLALEEEGLSIPDDVALIGYDDVKTSRYIGLSSMAQNMHDVGRNAANTLVDRIKSGSRPEPPIASLVVPELRTRRSSRFSRSS